MRMVAMATLALLGCKSHDEEATSVRASEPAAKAAPAVGKPALRGGIRREPRAYFGVIVPAGTKPEACEAIATKAAKASTFELILRRTTPAEIGWNTTPKVMFDEDLIPAGEREAIDKATVAIGLVTKSTVEDATLAHRVAEAALKVAEACHGWVIDVDVRRVITRATLAERVPGTTFLAPKMLTIHKVSGDNELGFLDTAGLVRLGLPELLVANVPASQGVAVNLLLNTTAQTLVDRRDLTRDGELDVDLATFAGNWGLEDIKARGGTGKITWNVRWSTPPHEDGDPVLELYVPGAEPTVALVAAIEKYDGANEDKVQNLDFQPELDSAAVQARAALGALRTRFAKGVPYNERLSIKAPFATDHDNVEWMWVDVFMWKRDAIEGTLGNTPDDVKALKLGSKVKVKFSDVADFIHRHGDGTNAGGFSFDVMRKHGIDVPPLSEM